MEDFKPATTEAVRLDTGDASRAELRFYQLVFRAFLLVLFSIPLLTFIVGVATDWRINVVTSVIIASPVLGLSLYGFLISYSPTGRLRDLKAANFMQPVRKSD